MGCSLSVGDDKVNEVDQLKQEIDQLKQYIESRDLKIKHLYETNKILVNLSDQSNKEKTQTIINCKKEIKQYEISARLACESMWRMQLR